VTHRASGLGAWLVQRVSAVYLGLYLLAVALWIGLSPPDSFQTWQERVAEPWFAAALLLFFLALLLHAWVGARDILMDYVRALWLRLSLLVALGLSLTACGLWAARVVLLAGTA
jgi:succinate dehydrogenase / fumarate reductase membrane anchor subunit